MNELTVAEADRPINEPCRRHITAFRLMLDREIQYPQCSACPASQDFPDISGNLPCIGQQQEHSQLFETQIFQSRDAVIRQGDLQAVGCEKVAMMLPALIWRDPARVIFNHSAEPRYGRRRFRLADLRSSTVAV
jgi:hypothetical protein